MTETVESLILDLVEWVQARDRTYGETLDVWRTSCPRLPVWEDAVERGLVETIGVADAWLVRPSAKGLALLQERRPGPR